jgi:hypothetical protein
VKRDLKSLGRKVRRKRDLLMNLWVLEGFAARDKNQENNNSPVVHHPCVGGTKPITNEIR